MASTASKKAYEASGNLGKAATMGKSAMDLICPHKYVPVRPSLAMYASMSTSKVALQWGSSGR